mmetsp:Transcript_16726/g.46744  ORF Transcript_16726/g.46744 Transcript_16726/m.46744 type:complete len:1275 (-) Transcript_16726:82-3906(-)
MESRRMPMASGPLCSATWWAAAALLFVLRESTCVLSAAAISDACPPGMEKEDASDSRCAYTLAVLLPACTAAEDGGSCDFWARRLAVALLAVDHINNRNSAIVPQADQLPQGFHVVPAVLNSGFVPDVAIEAVFEARNEGFIALIGPSRSEVAIPVATLGHVLHWPQVSFGAASAALGNTDQFQYFSRTTPTSASTSRAMAGIMRHYKWDHAAVVFPNDEWGVDFMSKLQESINHLNMQVQLHTAPYVSGNEDLLREALISTAASGSRLVISLLLNPDIAPAVEIADELGIIGPGYIWFGGDVSMDYGLPALRAAAAEDPAAQDALDRKIWLLQGVVKVSVEGKGPKWELVDSAFRGLNASTFRQRALEHNTPPFTADMYTPEFFQEGLMGFSSSTPAFAYDAVWAAALGIAANDTTWHSPEWYNQVGADYAKLRAETVHGQILETRFDGVSGPVVFEVETGNRKIAEVVDLVFEFFDSSKGSYVKAGNYLSSGDTLWLDMNVPVVWADGTTEVPSASPPASQVQAILIAVVATLAILLLLLAVGMFGYRQYVEKRIARITELRQKRKGPPKKGAQVTLAISDIQGSTSLWDSYPVSMASDVQVHHKVLRSMLGRTFGYEVATEGDSFICAFHTPEDAVTWAVLVQLNLLLAPWSAELEDGGHEVLEGQRDWAEIGCLQLPEFHAAAIDGLSSAKQEGQSVGGGASSTHLNPVFSPSHLTLGEKLKALANTYPTDTVEISGTAVPVFRGPRVRVGLHTGIATKVSTNPSTKRVVYEGSVAVLAKAISDTPCGGQIVMSGETLAAIHNMDELSESISGMCGRWVGPESGIFVMHLGAHRVLKEAVAPLDQPSSPDRIKSLRSRLSFLGELSARSCSKSSRLESATGNAMLMELHEGHKVSRVAELIQVVPLAIRARAKYFPAPSSLEKMAAAFSDAPSARGVTIVFAWADQLKEVRNWSEKMGAVASDLFVRLLQDLLVAHSGYKVECEHGSTFLLAFANPLQALHWALDVQLKLLEVEWPGRLLMHPAAAEVMDPLTGKAIFRGLRCGIGMCTGDAKLIQPCPRTGRAEYFGPIMNHAARVAYASAGGQVLVHERTWHTAQKAMREGLKVGARVPGHQVLDLGRHSLKGIRDAVAIYQINPPELSARQFPAIKTKMAMPSRIDHKSSSAEEELELSLPMTNSLLMAHLEFKGDSSQSLFESESTMGFTSNLLLSRRGTAESAQGLNGPLFSPIGTRESTSIEVGPLTPHTESTSSHSVEDLEAGHMLPNAVDSN